MIPPQEHITEAWWSETGAEEWSDAIVAAMKLGGVDHLFFVSGSELTAALGSAMVRNQPAATAVHVDVGTLHYGAAIHTAWRGGYPVLIAPAHQVCAMPTPRAMV